MKCCRAAILTIALIADRLLYLVAELALLEHEHRTTAIVRIARAPATAIAENKLLFELSLLLPFLFFGISHLAILGAHNEVPLLLIILLHRIGNFGANVVAAGGHATR